MMTPTQRLRKQARDRQHRNARREHYMRSQRCAICRYQHVPGDLDDLELHHLNPDEKVDHRIWSWSIPRLEAELAKCVWLCVECHKAVTQMQTRTTKPHGQSIAHYVRGCRCDACRACNARRERERRARRRMEAAMAAQLGAGVSIARGRARYFGAARKECNS